MSALTPASNKRVVVLLRILFPTSWKKKKILVKHTYRDSAGPLYWIRRILVAVKTTVSNPIRRRTPGVPRNLDILSDVKPKSLCLHPFFIPFTGARRDRRCVGGINYMRLIIVYRVSAEETFKNKVFAIEISLRGSDIFKGEKKVSRLSPSHSTLIPWA